MTLPPYDKALPRAEAAMRPWACDEAYSAFASVDDWRGFPSSMPREAVVYPKGKRKAALVERVRHAWRNIKIRPAPAQGIPAE